jgi:Tetratricopeptide repeat
MRPGPAPEGSLPIKRWRAAIVAGLVLYLGAAALASANPGPRLWGIHCIGFLPPAIAAAVWALLATGLALVVAGSRAGGEAPGKGRRPEAKQRQPGRRHFVWFLILSAILFWTLRARTHFLGDGTLWLARMESGSELQTGEPLAQALWQAVEHALRFVHLGVTPATIAPFSMACGIVAGALAWGIAREMSDALAFPYVLALIATIGSWQLFFGYIESYPLVAVAILWFLFAGIRRLRGSAGIASPALALSFSITGHIACAFLIPGYGFIVARTVRGWTRRLIAMAAPLALSVLLLAALGFGPARWGEAARVASLALRHGGAPQTPRDARPYAVPSLDHAVDFGNELLLVIPVALIVLAGRLVAGRHATSATRDPVVAFLGVTAASGLAAGASLVLPVAPAQDWDLFSLFLIPAGVLGALVAGYLGEGRGRTLTLRGLSVISGTLLASFVLVNAIPASGTRRYTTLLGSGAKITRYARAYGHEILAYYDRRRGDARAALGHAEAFRQDEPTNPRAWAMVGAERMALHDYKGAIGSLEESVRRGRNAGGTWTNLGICYTYEGNADAALASFQRAASVEPNRPEYKLNLALGLLKAGRPDSARAVLISAVRRWPRYRPALEALRQHFPAPR